MIDKNGGGGVGYLQLFTNYTYAASKWITTIKILVSIRTIKLRKFWDKIFYDIYLLKVFWYIEAATGNVP